jgi:uncharacterized protein (TIGR02284 family)
MQPIMEKNEALNEILNDLVKINNDRISEYERAIAESTELDIDLKSIFEEMIRQSSEHKAALSETILKEEGEVEDESTEAGKIYTAWMDIKSPFKENDRLSILTACEFGEDAAQRAYEAALAESCLVDGETRNLILEQQSSLKKSHDLIKKQRDAYKALQK